MLNNTSYLIALFVSISLSVLAMDFPENRSPRSDAANEEELTEEENDISIQVKESVDDPIDLASPAEPRYLDYIKTIKDSGKNFVIKHSVEVTMTGLGLISGIITLAVHDHKVLCVVPPILGGLISVIISRVKFCIRAYTNVDAAKKFDEIGNIDEEIIDDGNDYLNETDKLPSFSEAFKEELRRYEND